MLKFQTSDFRFKVSKFKFPSSESEASDANNKHTNTQNAPHAIEKHTTNAKLNSVNAGSADLGDFSRALHETGSAFPIAF